MQAVNGRQPSKLNLNLNKVKQCEEFASTFVVECVVALLIARTVYATSAEVKR